MYKLYWVKKNRSYRQLRDYLVNNEIPFVERHITENEPLQLEELYEILSKTENGLEDIVSVKSKAYRDLIAFSPVAENEFYETKLSTALKFLQLNPSAVKTPILTTPKLACIGYSEEEISVILPRETKKRIYQQLLKSAM